MNSLDTVTILAVLVFIVSLLDKAAVTKWVQALVNKPSPQMDTLNNLISSRREIEQERNTLSAQDNYARWTKLNRRLDKLDAEISTLSSQIKTSRASTSMATSTAISVILAAPQWILRLFYARTAVVHLIPGINSFPKPFSWILRFPWGKYNSISAVFWAAAIDIVLSTFKNWIVASIQLSQAGKRAAAATAANGDKNGPATDASSD